MLRPLPSHPLQESRHPIHSRVLTIQKSLFDASVSFYAAQNFTQLAAAFGDSGWGAKASEVLLRVRGKDFRHEKTKKKRGTYRGGAVSLATNSIKFDD